MLGRGEAGKTSLLAALKADDNKSKRLGIEKRTIGIDMDYWLPASLESTATPLKFRCLDFAGN